MDSNKKLVTHKGVTVTKGYLEGTMDFEDTVLYLSKLGIHGLFEEVVRKAVFVPPGFQAQHQVSQRTYQQGDFIPVPEHNWEAFVQAAQSERNENWIITEVPVIEGMQSVDSATPTSSEDYQKAMDSLLDKYDENQLGVVFRHLMQQAESIEDVQMREAQKNSIHELAQDIDTRMKLAEELASNRELKLSEIIDAREIINEFRVQSDIKHIPAKNKLSLTIGKGALHLGAFIAAMEISGNAKVIGLIKDEFDKMAAGKQQSTRLEIDTKSIFPGGLKNAKEIAAYRDMLDLLRFDLDDDALILGVSRVTAALEDIYDKRNIVATPREIIDAMSELKATVQSTLAQLEDRKQADALHQSVFDAVNSTQFKIAVSETRRSIDSGNLMVQSLLDFSYAVSDRLTDNVISLLDDTFDFEYSLGVSLAEKLKPYTNLAGVPIPTEVRREIKDALYTLPLGPAANFKKGVATDKLNTLITSVRTAFGSALQQGGLGGSSAKVSHITDAIVDEVLLAKRDSVAVRDQTFENPVEGLKHIATNLKVGDVDTFVRVFTAEAVNNLRMSNNANIQTAQCRDILLSTIDVYTALTGDGIEKPDPKSNFNDIRQVVAASLTAFNRQMKTGRSKLVDREGNLASQPQPAPTSKSTTSKLRQDAIEGISALFFHTLTRNNTVPADNIDYDARRRAAVAATYFCGASGLQIDPNHGAFVNTSPDGTTFLNMRVLSLARFLPPISRDGYQWAPELRSEMDTEIAAKKGKSLEDITDIDRLEHFASSESPVKAIHALGENVRAGLSNVTVGNTNLPGARKSTEALLDSNQVRRIRSIVDYDTDVGRQNQRLGNLHRTVQGYMGSRKATEAEVSSLANGPIDPKDFKDVSLAHLIDRSIRDSAGKLIPEGQRYGDNYSLNIAEIAVSRAEGLIGDNVSPHVRTALTNYVRSTVMNAVEKVKSSGSQTGYDGEAVLNLSVPLSLMKDATDIEFLSPSVVAVSETPVKNERGKPVKGEDGKPLIERTELKEQHTWRSFNGLKWKSADGSTHYFGGPNGRSNGAIDDVHIEHKPDGTVIFSGMETKMEAGEPPLPHTGNATHITRLLANYYLEHEDDIKKIIFNDNTLLSASYGTPEQNTFAGGYSYNRRGSKFLAAGIGFGEGSFSKKGEAR